MRMTPQKLYLKNASDNLFIGITIVKTLAENEIFAFSKHAHLYELFVEWRSHLHFCLIRCEMQRVRLLLLVRIVFYLYDS